MIKQELICDVCGKIINEYLELGPLKVCSDNCKNHYIESIR